jgi:transmembrane sensor
MHEKEFEKLIKRCLAGQATKQEAALVEKWLDHRSNEDPFSKLPVSEREKIRINIYKGFLSKTTESGRSLTKEKPGRAAVTFYRAAAAIMLISVFSYTLLKLASSSVEERITVIHSVSSFDGTKKVILGDSSIVWLKGNSSIIYPEQFEGKERNVKLTGEALFEVSKDPDNPFIIQCGNLTAKVLGTSFNIRSSETDIEVLVLTGKVALSSKGNSMGLIVRPNEKAVYNHTQNHMAKVMAMEKEKTAKITGTQYSMRFHATRMDEIIRRIEGKFDVRVSLSDPRLNNCTITADFTDQSLDRTLSMIAQTLEIEYEIKDNQVALKGGGCD